MTEMQPEFSTRMLAVFRAIDDVLVSHHTLRASLKSPHPPLGEFEGNRWIPTPLDVGVARYGEGPLFGLWAECRAVEALRIAWTGKPSHEPLADAVPEVEPAPTEAEVAAEGPTP